ncbi:MAG: peptidoglycan D,D-transpeptidase FtsI family protein [Alphaproteobacteria bacterium]
MSPRPRKRKAAPERARPFPRPPRPDPVRLEGTALRAIETGRTRLTITGVLIGIAFIAIAGRLIDVTLLKEGAEPRLAGATRAAAIETGRAEITDRNGVLLATSLATASLYADTRQVPDPAAAANRLATALPDADPAELHRRLASGRSFIWLRRNLTPRQQYAVNRLGIPGLDFQREERRVYPQGRLASHLLGFTDVDDKGLAGIERAFDSRLRGGGGALALSIDVRVQHLVRQEIQRALTEFKALGATGIVMDARTGEVLAMESLPDFDPNDAAAGPPGARFNRATLGVYEMGSTFKIFTAAMALDSGALTLADGYDASKPIRVARFVIRDFKPKKRWLSVPEIFMYSSNIGIVKMALDVGTAEQRMYLRRFGLLDPAPIEFDEVGQPLVPSPWREISTMTVAFGHGISVSPVQLTSAVASVVDGGVMHPPTLLRRDPAAPVPGVRVISERTSEQMRRLLRLVVAQGTGRNAAAPGYLVGGKTGTAEKVGARGYQRKSLISSFVGAFPMNDPRYVVLVLVDEPKGNARTFGYATGGWVAAPAVGRIIARMGPMMGIAPLDETAPALREQMRIALHPRGRTLASY